MVPFILPAFFIAIHQTNQGLDNRIQRSNRFSSPFKWFEIL